MDVSVYCRRIEIEIDGWIYEVKFLDARTDRDLEVCKHMFRCIVTTMLLYVNPQWQEYETKKKLDIICNVCKKSELEIALVKKDTNVFMKII